MTVEEFRGHQHLPIQWRKELRTNGLLQLVLEVLQAAHPDRFPVHTDLNDDISPTKAALQLGETRGYSKALNTIAKLAEPVALVQNAGPPTYEPHPKETLNA